MQVEKLLWLREAYEFAETNRSCSLNSFLFEIGLVLQYRVVLSSCLNLGNDALNWMDRQEKCSPLLNWPKYPDSNSNRSQYRLMMIQESALD